MGFAGDDDDVGIVIIMLAQLWLLQSVQTDSLTQLDNLSSFISLENQGQNVQMFKLQQLKYSQTEPLTDLFTFTTFALDP